jgi:hypothetical protein
MSTSCEEVSIQFICPLLIGLLVLLVFNLLSSLHILDINLLSDEELVKFACGSLIISFPFTAYFRNQKLQDQIDIKG